MTHAVHYAKALRYAADDDEAFVRRINESPADPVPRLVYADYLDETGRPDTARFVRQDADPETFGHWTASHPEGPLVAFDPHVVHRTDPTADHVTDLFDNRVTSWGMSGRVRVSPDLHSLLLAADAAGAGDVFMHETRHSGPRVHAVYQHTGSADRVFAERHLSRVVTLLRARADSARVAAMDPDRAARYDRLADKIAAVQDHTMFGSSDIR